MKQTFLDRLLFITQRNKTYNQYLITVCGTARSRAIISGNLVEKIYAVYERCPHTTQTFLILISFYLKTVLSRLVVFCPDMILSVCRLKSLGEGCKVWSSSAPNLGKSPKHAPMTAGFSSLNEMGESFYWELCLINLDENLILTLFHVFSVKQRSAASLRSRQGLCCPQRPAVTGPWTTRGPCGAAWGPTRCRLVAPVREAWGRGRATRTRSVAAARGRRVTCCCWAAPLCSRPSPSGKTCCSWENYR